MAEDPRKKAKETAEIVEDAFRNIASNIKDIFNEALDSTDDFAKTLSKDITRSLNSAARDSGTLVTNQIKIAEGALKIKDIDKQRIVNQAKIEGIARQLNIAEKSGLITSIEKTKKLSEIKGYNEEINAELDEQAKTLKGIDKLSGSYDNLAKGIKSIPGLGPILADPFENMAKNAKMTATSLSGEGGKGMSAFSKKAKVAGSAFKGLATGVGKSVMKGGPWGILLLVIKKVVEALIMADKQSTDISRNLGASVDGAEGIRDAMIAVKDASDKTSVTLQNTLDTMFKISSILGVSTNVASQLSYFEKERLESLTHINQTLGLSEQSFSRLTKLSYMTGENAGDIVNRMAGMHVAVGLNNETMFNSKEILEETLSLSDSIYLKFRFQTGEIAKAVAESKLLGFSLSDIESTQSSLLNFESSIAAELNAELLTGKELNLERARYFALNDQIPGNFMRLGKELEQQLGTLEEFNSMNFLKRESLAKAFGFTEEKVIQILTKQKELKNLQKLTNDEDFAATARRALGLKEADKITQEHLQTLITSGKLTEDQFKKVEKAFGESSAAMMEREGASKRFERAMEQLQEVLVRLVKGNILNTLVTAIEDLVLALTGDQSLLSIMTGGIDEGIVAKGKIAQIEKERSDLEGKDGVDKIINKKKLEDLAKKEEQQEKIIAREKEIDTLWNQAKTLSLFRSPAYQISNILMGNGLQSWGDIEQRGIKPLEEFAVGGIVNRPTRALIGEAGAEAVIPLNEFYAKIDQLISAVTANRDVYMDGRLVGDAVAARSFK